MQMIYIYRDTPDVYVTAYQVRIYSRLLTLLRQKNDLNDLRRSRYVRCVPYGLPGTHLDYKSYNGRYRI